MVLAAALWGPWWSSRRVEFCSDNMAVVEVLRSGTSRDPNLMALLHRLSLLTAQLSLSDYSQAMLWAACCLDFFGVLRAGEFTVNEPFDPAIHLTPQDLQLDSTSKPTCLRVQIKASKTDPFHQGCFIYLDRGHTSICPIASLMAYLHRRSPAPGPLFLQENGQPLTRTQLSNFFQSNLSAVGITGTYSGHSFHTGAATTATQQGLLDHLIKTMGRWSSDAYLPYVRTPVQSILNISGQLL